MGTRDIQSTITEGLRELQKLSGRQWKNLTDDSKPIGDLEGFDSVAGIEATAYLEEMFGCQLEDESIFVSKDGTRALSLQEVGQRISASLAKAGH